MDATCPVSLVCFVMCPHSQQSCVCFGHSNDDLSQPLSFLIESPQFLQMANIVLSYFFVVFNACAVTLQESIGAN